MTCSSARTCLVDPINTNPLLSCPNAIQPATKISDGQSLCNMQQFDTLSCSYLLQLRQKSNHVSLLSFFSKNDSRSFGDGCCNRQALLPSGKLRAASLCCNSHLLRWWSLFRQHWRFQRLGFQSVFSCQRISHPPIPLRLCFQNTICYLCLGSSRSGIL